MYLLVTFHVVWPLTYEGGSLCLFLFPVPAVMPSSREKNTEYYGVMITLRERESAAKSQAVMTVSNTPPRYGVEAWRDPVARNRPCHFESGLHTL